MIKVVILAAGVGSRLDDTEDHLPKPLTLLENGQSILQFQLENLRRYLPSDQMIIVVGYQKEKIMNSFPSLSYVYNASFAAENTSKSLLKALRTIEEDVLWLNGDVVFHPSIIETLIKEGRTSLVVNRAPVGEEEVKYRADKRGRLLEISKHVDRPHGEVLGINFFKKNDLPLLKNHLERCLPTDYFEKGIELGIKQGQQVGVTVVGTQECAEIDFPEDLAKANLMLRQWKIS